MGWEQPLDVLEMQPEQDAEGGTARQEMKRKSKVEIYGCGKRKIPSCNV